MEDNLSSLVSRATKDIILWAKESYLRTVLVVFFGIVLLPVLIGYLQDVVRTIPYIAITLNIVGFFNKNFKLTDYIFTLFFILTSIFIYYFYQQIKNTSCITENFDKDLNGWNFRFGYGWTIQNASGLRGKMLSVTNSDFPGTLKAAYGWYDYEITFQAKIDSKLEKSKENFTVFIRSENNLNGVMFQISPIEVRPHLLYNGIFILDTKNNFPLPTELKRGDWVDVKIIVSGNNVNIWINNYKLQQYIIPTRVFNTVPNSTLTETQTTIENLEKKNEEVEKKEKLADEAFKKFIKTPAGPEKDAAKQEVLKVYQDIPSYSRVILEYPKGSVGFRQVAGEHAYFRKLKVKKI